MLEAYDRKDYIPLVIYIHVEDRFPADGVAKSQPPIRRTGRKRKKKGQKMTTDSEEKMDMEVINDVTQRILMLMAMHMEEGSQSHTGKDLYCYGSCLQILWALRCNIREK